jgi:hypothetical protein
MAVIGNSVLPESELLLRVECQPAQVNAHSIDRGVRLCGGRMRAACFMQRNGQLQSTSNK